MKKKYKLVFFGSPEFALPPLKTLYLGGYEIVGVYSQEPKKKFRGMKESATPVHQWAESQLLPVFTPKKLDHSSLKKFQSLKPDIAVLFAYGKIIPANWLNVPLYGFINIHASLLPKWRGAAPVQRAIENGDQSTGITIMKMNEGLDEGPIIASKEIPITKNTTGKSLIEQISYDSCPLLFDNLEKYLSAKISPIEQDNSRSTYAKKIKKLETKIIWSQNAEDLNQKIRAFYPYPSMWFLHHGLRYKILKANVSEATGEPGKIIKRPLTIACKKGSLNILEIQPEGKTSMSIDQFLLGNNSFSIGTNLLDG
jgi:methionyl-tRNA formyltransferase